MADADGKSPSCAPRSYSGDEIIRILFAAVIFISAYLLFSLEPLVARRILPWFGGSAAVWSTCLVFYQAALLAGYVYARLLTRYLRPRAQTIVHIALLLLSLALLPIGPSARWQPLTAAEHPAVLIFRMLSSAIGLPFIALSATSPLLQSWLARAGFDLPYRMFAVSNLASLIALLAYPSVIEPLLGTHAQSVGWSLVYLIFVLLCSFAAWQSRSSPVSASGGAASLRTRPLRTLYWFGLAACGSMLLLSVTNHIDENVAAVPLIWVLPLATYLLSFVFSFGALNIYRPALWIRLLAFALGMMGYAIYNINALLPIQLSLPIFLAGLFVCCIFCHGELNRLRPPVAELTNFYLVVAGGGAAGAILVGLLASHFFNGIYELPLTLISMALLALALTCRERAWAASALWIAVTGCMIAVMVMNVRGYRQNSLSMVRSFYGTLRVTQTQHAGPEQERILFHGIIEHGSEFLLPPKRSRPTTYYGPDSGIGIVLRECFNVPKRVGVVGLGVGTVAAYGNAGDAFHFYELNSQVVDIARALFFFLKETPARIRITVGDGQISLAHETAPPFDVIALDAFSGDAIPVHLLTKQAMAVYLHHLKANGVIAFHVSNNFLDLAPVVEQLAQSAGYRAELVHSHADQDEDTLPADWVLVTNNRFVLDNPSIRVHAKPIVKRAGLRLWTDDYSSLLPIFKTPKFNR